MCVHLHLGTLLTCVRVNPHMHRIICACTFVHSLQTSVRSCAWAPGWDLASKSEPCTYTRLCRDTWGFFFFYCVHTLFPAKAIYTGFPYTTCSSSGSNALPAGLRCSSPVGLNRGDVALFSRFTDYCRFKKHKHMLIKTYIQAPGGSFKSSIWHAFGLWEDA